MNHTLDKATVFSCGFPFLPTNPVRISPYLRAVFIVRIVVNALTCPLIILLNILVIVAVKTKRQLRTKSNIALACLATTDLAAGLVVQPLHIASSVLLFDAFCSLFNKSNVLTRKCIPASLYHLFLISLERYIAIKHPFIYENKVTEDRIIIASGLAWAAAVLLQIEQLLHPDSQLSIRVALYLPPLILIPAIIYFNVSVYKEVGRNEKQIAANQVSSEAKEKILKNKKALYTTTIVLLAMFLCYFPATICANIVNYFQDTMPTYNAYAALCLVTLLPVLNSMFNPLIYAVRIRYFRVAFIQLLSRKTISQAEELERKIFGAKQNGVIANTEQFENIRGSQEDEQGHGTLNNGHDTTVRT